MKRNEVTLILALTLTMLTVGAGVCRADIAYAVDLAGSISGGISVIGHIETDGTIGALEPSDITNWNLELTNTYGMVDLNNGNSDLVEFGTDMIATASTITYDFSGSDQGAFVVNGAGEYWQLVTGSRASLPEGYATMLTVGNNATASYVPGTETIGTAPEPSSVLLLSTALLGVAFAARHRIAPGPTPRRVS